MMVCYRWGTFFVCTNCKVTQTWTNVDKTMPQTIPQMTIFAAGRKPFPNEWFMVLFTQIIRKSSLKQHTPKHSNYRGCLTRHYTLYIHIYVCVHIYIYTYRNGDLEKIIKCWYRKNKPSPNHHFYGWYKPSKLGGVWHCYTHSMYIYFFYIWIFMFVYTFL